MPVIGSLFLLFLIFSFFLFFFISAGIPAYYCPCAGGLRTAQTVNGHWQRYLSHGAYERIAGHVAMAAVLEPYAVQKRLQCSTLIPPGKPTGRQKPGHNGSCTYRQRPYFQVFQNGQNHALYATMTNSVYMLLRKNRVMHAHATMIKIVYIFSSDTGTLLSCSSLPFIPVFRTCPVICLFKACSFKYGKIPAKQKITRREPSSGSVRVF